MKKNFQKGKKLLVVIYSILINRPNILLITLITFLSLLSIFFYQRAEGTNASGHKFPLEGVAIHGLSPAGDGAANGYIDLAVDSSGRLIVVSPGGGTSTQVEGTIADDGSATQRPVLVSGKFLSPRTTVSDGQHKSFAISNEGDLEIAIARRHKGATVNAGNNSIAADTTLNVAATNLRLIGISIRESAATPAVASVILRHGIVAAGNCTGNEIAYLELGLNESLQIQYPNILAVASGVCADVLAGTIDVATQTVVEANP